MKKIIAAFDGLQLSESIIPYAVGCAQKSNAHLVGISLEDFSRHGYKFADLVDEQETIDKKVKKLSERDTHKRKFAVKTFNEACAEAGITCAIHHDKNFAIQELLHESIYADLLLIDVTETLTNFPKKPPTRFIRELLESVQCPVLLVPPKYKPIEKITFLYDGEPSSVSAIRMFSYMSDLFDNLPVEVITVKNQLQNLHVPDNKLIKEFMKRHFPVAKYTVLKGHAETEIITYLKTQKVNTMVVCGAYQRGMVSRWFRASMADVIMERLNLPLFIAHFR